jgi:deoxyribose-phosphate aldolase
MTSLSLTDKDIVVQIASIVNNKGLIEDKEVLKTIFNCIDLTTLKETDSAKSVQAFVESVNEFAKNLWICPILFLCCSKQVLKGLACKKGCSGRWFPCFANFFGY